MIAEDKTTLNLLWSSLIVEELVRLGVSHFCLSPGNRSAPLACAVRLNPNAEMSMHFDERGSAFSALGIARATGKPAAWITTSGTAVAHGLPALIEAANDKVPLILLTADRPPELRDTGANQVIDQVKIFGDYCRWFFDLPAPNIAVPPQFVLTTINQGFYRSVSAPRGPVHINCMFRDPLAPEDDGVNYKQYMVELKDWKSSKLPYTSYAESQKTPTETCLRELVSKIKGAQRGLIVVGKLPEYTDHAPLLNLFSRLGWPVFPDITSGLRLLKSDHIIPFYDQLLLSKDFQQSQKPDVILHLGEQIVSKRLQTFLESSGARDYLLIKNSPHRYDPGHKISFSLEASVEATCELVSGNFEQSLSLTAYAGNLKEQSTIVAGEVESFCQRDNKLTEIGVAYQISQILPENSGLYLGSSMPIRDMDMYAAASGVRVKVASNRGASGIDGNIATASGFSKGLAAPVTAIMGDLAFLHDLNSLSMLRNLKHPMILIVINNNGGGIFSFLPVANNKEVFEPCFGTPHDVGNFKKAAELFCLDYEQPVGTEEFLSNYRRALKQKRATIIEVVTDRQENLKLHKELQGLIIDSLS